MSWGIHIFSHIFLSTFYLFIHLGGEEGRWVRRKEFFYTQDLGSLAGWSVQSPCSCNEMLSDVSSDGGGSWVSSSGVGQSGELGTQSRSFIWVPGIQPLELWLLPVRYAFAGSWNWDRDAGVLTGILIARPGVCVQVSCLHQACF